LCTEAARRGLFPTARAQRGSCSGEGKRGNGQVTDDEERSKIGEWRSKKSQA